MSFLAYLSVDSVGRVVDAHILTDQGDPFPRKDDSLGYRFLGVYPTMNAAGEKQIMNEKLLSSLTVTVIPKKPTRNSNFRKGDGPFVVKLSYYEGDGYVYRTLIDVPYNEMCLFLRHPVARTCVFKVGRWPFKRVQEVSYALNVRVRNTFGAASWINAHLSVSGLTEIPGEH